MNKFGLRGQVGSLTIRRGADWAPRAKNVDLSLRAIGDATDPGGFEGWACVFDVEDTYGTTFRSGCFTEGGLEDTAYPLLWMHNGVTPLGTFTAEERAEGLWVSGTYDATPDGQAARARALSGSAPELSVGFVWLDDGGEDAPDDITKARLVETSQITLRMAAVPGATLQAARSEDEDALDASARARSTAAALLNLRLLECEI